jgi:hypothetical protein
MYRGQIHADAEVRWHDEFAKVLAELPRGPEFADQAWGPRPGTSGPGRGEPGPGEQGAGQPGARQPAAGEGAGQPAAGGPDGDQTTRGTGGAA